MIFNNDGSTTTDIELSISQKVRAAAVAAVAKDVIPCLEDEDMDVLALIIPSVIGAILYGDQYVSGGTANE